VTYLLDTNTCIAHLTGRSGSVSLRLRNLSPGDVVICSVVKAELLFGARKSQRSEENMAHLRRFLAPMASLAFDDDAAATYANIRAGLEQAGSPIGPNDLLIASIALSRGCIVVTANTREFSRVPGLAVENWT